MILDEVTARMVANSATASAEALDDIAHRHATLQQSVARHPNASPETLAWIASCGTPDARSAAGYRLEAIESATKAPQPGFLRRRPAVVAGIVGIVVVALTVWFVVAGPNADKTMHAAPAGVTWRELPISRANRQKSIDVADAGGGIALIRMVSGNDGGLNLDAWGTVDIATGTRSFWTILTDSAQQYLVGDGTVVVQASSGLSVIDLHKGTTINAPSLGPGENLSEIAGTTLLTLDKGTTGTMVRARSIYRPVNVVWLANAATPYVQTFGGGHWINTNRGVLDVASGQPAPFGADSFVDASGLTFVYQGPDADHILRMTCAKPNSGCVLQRWSPTTDSGTLPTIGPVVQACPGSSLVTVAQSGSGAYITAAYDWDSGKQLWTAGEFPDSSCGQFVGDLYLLQSSVGGDTFVTDATSGRWLWYSQGAVRVAITDLAYVQQGDKVDAYDPTNGFKYQWSIDVPSAGADIQAIGNRLVAVDSAAGRMWLLTQP